MGKLPLPVVIHADEYLPGLLARATAFNGLTSVYDVLQLAGVNGAPYAIANKDPTVAVKVAAALGAEPETISSLWLPDVPGDMVVFYGAEIRKANRLVKIRRIAPRTLSEGNPYVRAMWQLKPLNFDPRTLERLLSHCPVCNRELGFARSFDVCFCENCVGADEFGLPEAKVDLRDFPQEILTVNDREALDFVTGLIDPDPVARAQPAVALHDDWKTLSRGEIFEAALSLACVSARDHRRKTNKIGRPNAPEAFASTYAPDNLAEAGRMIMTWPQSFYDFCDVMRQSVSDRGTRGHKTEFGPIGALQKDPTVPAKVREIFAAAIQSSKIPVGSPSVPLGLRRRDGMISQADAIRKYGLPSRGLKRLQREGLVKVFPTRGQLPAELLDEDEVAQIAARTKRTYDIGTVSVRFGLPRSAVLDLEQFFVLTPETGVVAFPTERKTYTQQSVELFERRLIALARNNDDVLSRPVKLLTAVGNYQGVRKPWAAIVRAILKRKLSIVEIGNEGLPLFDRLGIAASNRINELAVVDQPSHDPGECITVPEAALVLGASVNETRDLISLGMLPAGGTLTRGDAVSATAKYIFAREIAKRFGIAQGRSLLPNLAKKGVHPVFALRRRGRCGFSRVDVEAALERNSEIAGDNL